MDAETQRQLEALMAYVAAPDRQFYTEPDRTREDHAEYQHRREYLEALREASYALASC